VIELAYAHMHACKLQALAMREDQIRDQVAAYGGICMQYGVSGSGDLILLEAYKSISWPFFSCLFLSFLFAMHDLLFFISWRILSLES